VTVEDPETWPTPWTAAVSFKATNDPIYDYACHEANYSLERRLVDQTGIEPVTS
jgi:hypothetical protein